MTVEGIDKLIAQGEGTEVEFKESFFELNRDVFDSICAFLNRKGGHLLLGISNVGKVEGVLEEAVDDIVNQIVTNANNLQKLNPVFYLAPEVIDYQGKKLIYVWVPESSQVHHTVGKIFDRNRDGDFEVTNRQHLIRDLHLRKQQSYTENRIYPALQLSDFREDLFQKIRNLAKSQRPDHPWLSIDDRELLRSAGLYQKDYQNGQEGFTLAAALLLGKDEVIQSLLPHYRTDAIYRVVNTDRYDDRDDIRTNLIEAYERLMAFVAKHLPERFHQEGTQRVNLRDRLFHEVVTNLLVHREFANAFPAKLIIEKQGVSTENWNKPHSNGIIDPSNFAPFPKNPIIARFFREIGRMEELGSGVRNMYKYGLVYSEGNEPELIEGDIFTAFIPILSSIMHVSFEDALGVTDRNDDDHDGNHDRSIDDAVNDTVNDAVNDTVNDAVNDTVNDTIKKRLVKIILFLYRVPGARKEALMQAAGTKEVTFKRDMQKLKGLAEFRGAQKTGGYYLTTAMAEKLYALNQKK